MKKNFFKKKLASALALALVVASFSPAGISAQAATATKIVKQGGGAAPTVLYVGGSKVDYSLSTIKSGVKYTWKSSNTKIATITATTGVVTAKAPGSVTITATATNKKTGKVLNTFKKTLTVNLRSTSVEVGDDFTLTTGETKKLAATLTPSNSTDVINYVSSNKDVATVGLTGGVVTGKAAGEATITVYAKATKSSSNKSTKTKVDTVKVTVPLGISAIKQTKASTFELTFNGKVESVKTSDFVIKRDTTNEAIYVKSATVKDGVVTLTTFVDLKDGKDYTLTYGDKTYGFKVTDGVVSSLSFAPTSIVYGTGTSITVSTLDAKGIVLKTYKYGEATNGELDFTITTTQGYTVGDQLFLYAEGNTATAKATFHTKKYDEFGKEVGAITAEATIYAVPATAVSITDTKYTIAANDKKPDFAKDTLVTSLAIKDQSKAFYFYAKDSAGKELAAGAYKFESSDSNKLIVSDAGNAFLGAYVVAVSEGSAYVLVKDVKTGAVIYSLPVTIVAERKADSMTLSTYAFALSNSGSFLERKVIDVTLLDQYQVKLDAPTNIKVELLTAPNDAAKAAFNATYYTTAAGKVTFNGEAFGANVGTYVFAIKSGDLTRTVSVTVNKPEGNTSYALELSAQTIDGIYTGSDKSIEANLIVKKGAASDKYVDPSNYTITVKKGDTAIATNVTADANGYVIDIAKAGTTYVSKAAVGNYVVTVTVKNDADGLKAGQTFTNGFTVTDTQGVVTAVVKNVNAAGATLESAIIAAFDFYYNGTKLDASKVDIISDSDITTTNIPNGNSVHVYTGTVYVLLENGKFVPFNVTFNQTVTVNK
jgi:hypothetical protein